MSRIYRALETAQEKEQEKVSKNLLSGILEKKSTAAKEENQLGISNWETERLEIPSGEERAILIAPPHSFAEEQFLKLKGYILRRSPRPPNSILITSSGPGEGKTTVAVNLAVVFSHESNRKVFLIDADMKRPTVYPKKFLASRGLSDYLTGRSAFTEIMTTYEGERFTFILSGTHSAKHSELIGSKKMEELLKNFKEYGSDTIILIDSAPVLSSSEPFLLSEWVDGVILVVMAGQVPKAAIKRVVESIGRKKIIGVVFNEKYLKHTQRSDKYYYRYHKK